MTSGVIYIIPEMFPMMMRGPPTMASCGMSSARGTRARLSARSDWVWPFRNFPSVSGPMPASSDTARALLFAEESAAEIVALSC